MTTRHRRSPSPVEGPWADLPTYLPGCLEEPTTLLDPERFRCTAPPAFTDRWADWTQPRALLGEEVHRTPEVLQELGHRAALALVHPYELANALLQARRPTP